MVSSIVEQTIVANGSTVYGQIVSVSKDTYDRDLPGVGRESFSVSVSGTRDRAPFAAGFRNVSDVKRFLHSITDETFTVHGVEGDERKEVRTGLGIPVGMVSQFGSDGPTYSVDDGDGAERVPTTSVLGTNQVSETVTTEDANTRGKQDAKNAKQGDKATVPNDASKANQS